ncbi:LOW QUALITY PROTEIN: endosomal transmembrane epsin interactor 1 [Ctenopharyngodon idella]|uniref:LOW QUALITY PROTEIN: endosomal transmembrane epsin interactor 1 n=1 Tax=Ctenopharyngodon idella TaxID=7959 RepID=UPI00223191CE|nr:LOW QUALITY PROTEIN: endosomal transmembrane epsin interactor 1 [Ctenopharyngodon idella]
MSLPVVLPGSCCRLSGAALAHQLANVSYRSRSRCVSALPSRMSGSQTRIIPALLPARPLLSLGLLQLVLGCSMVALSFGALSLSNSPPIRNSCPFWAGSSVILSGIIGLTTWKRPMLLLVNLFVLLSVVCILLNLAGFILCCQGAQLVSSTINCQLSEQGDLCYCCSETPSTQCQEEKLIKIYAGHACGTMRILLKKVLFALCALNALATAVCLVAAALRYLQIFSTRRPCMEEARPVPEEVEEQTHLPDPDEFVAPAPPPSYFSTFYSYTPRLARRMFGDGMIPLPHIYGARIKGVEVFCPLDPPPPYEAVASQPAAQAQNTEVQMTDLTEVLTESAETEMPSDDRSCQTAILSPTPPIQSRQPHTAVSSSRKPHRTRLRRSNSDPVLLDLTAKVMSCEAATQTELGSGPASVTGTAHGTVTLRRGRGKRKPRPNSMVDYQNYKDTKLLVARFLEQSSCSLTPEVQELVNSIKTVLRSDEEHMEEAVRCASFIDQAITVSEVAPAQSTLHRKVQTELTSNTLPLRKRPGILHLRSCGDLSSFTWAQLQTGPERRTGTHSRTNSRMGSRAGSRRLEQERPHSLIGVFRETVL